MRERIRTMAALLASLLLLVACTKQVPPPSATSAVAVGVAAPAFTLPSSDGSPVSLADFLGHRPVLLYFSMGPG